jgi:hypothetical protein
MAQAPIHAVTENELQQFRMLLLYKLHVNVGEMTHHLHDTGISLKLEMSETPS